MNNYTGITTIIPVKRFHSSLSNYPNGYLLHKYDVTKWLKDLDVNGRIIAKWS
jgi:hypothetical protein